MKNLSIDFRHALRSLTSKPGSTLVALAMLALGIGGTTAIFSVFYSVLLQPLPFSEPERIVQVWETRLQRNWRRASFTEANFWDLRAMNKTFEELAVHGGGGLNLTSSGYPERLSAARVSAGFFTVLGVKPVLGRTFLPGEDEAAQPNRLVILGNEFWRTRFGADPGIIGKSLTLDGRLMEVIGVLPAGEPWLNERDVFVPFVHNPDANRVSFEFSVIGRLRRGVSLETARSDLSAVCKRLEEQYPKTNEGMGIDIVSASRWIASDQLRLALWVLMGGVASLHLIACVNLANLLVAKSTGQMREAALRIALGASRGRIVRLVLTESLCLSCAGAALGLVLARWGVAAFRALDPGDIPRLTEAGINVWVLGFTLVTALVTGALSGLLPAFHVPYGNVVEALREGDRFVAGSRTRNRLRNTLVAVEIALSLTLLVGAGLLMRSFTRLLRVERGFQSESRLVVSVNPAAADRKPERMRPLLGQFLERVSSMPQVLSAAAVSSRPLVGGATGMGIVAAGKTPDPKGAVPWAQWRLVTGEYFRTMAIPLLRGRTFTEQDMFDKSHPPARAIVSQRLADLIWPGEDPIGRRAVLWQGQDNVPGEVIGVVGNMRERGLEFDPTMVIYLPYYGIPFTPIQYVIHTGGDPMAIVAALRGALAEINPGIPLSNARKLEEILDGSLATRRFNTLLLGIFAAVALVLALVGIYGVLAYTVARRTSEIGIRVALGASSRSVLSLIILQGMRPILLGIVAGLICAFGLSRLLTGLLFGVAPGDPLTYTGVALLVGAAALVSCLIPARRALHIDPVEALRIE